MYCPAETPEGVKIGMIKHFAFLTVISNNITDEEYEMLLRTVKNSMNIKEENTNRERTAKKEATEGKVKKENCRKRNQQTLKAESNIKE